MSFESLLNNTCTIQTKTTSFSGTGASTVSFANKATNVKCTIQPNSGKLISRQEAEQLNITHLAFYLIGANIVAGDKVIDSDSNEYIVKRVFDAAGRVRHLEVLLELLEKA
jgi:SPP1 family predicted phage head-tail adaptor